MSRSLVDILTLERAGPDCFRGWSPDPDAPRIFGGSVVAQALMAAAATVEGRACHSLHAYFIHPGDGAKPILFEVDRARDGGMFATRRVVALQDGRQILNLAASFQAPAQGVFDHQHAMPADIAGVDALSDDDLRGEAVGLQLRNSRLPRPGMVADARPPHHAMWFRSRLPLGDNPALHQAALAYASDYPQLPTIVQPHPVTWRTPGFQFTSLDHSLWFHRPLDFTRWHLCSLDTPIGAGERGLSRGTIYDADGLLVASVAQEAMIRMRG